MPIVNGEFQHWWNWSARDPATGKMKTFITNGFRNIVTAAQLRHHVGIYFAHLDFFDFSCELTDKLPQNKRECVPKEFRMDKRQIEYSQKLPGASPQPNLITANRSILYGKQISQPEERRDGASDGIQRRVSILFGE